MIQLKALLLGLVSISLFKNQDYNNNLLKFDKPIIIADNNNQLLNFKHKAMKKVLALASSTLTYLSITAPAFAQNIGVELPNQAKITDLGYLISTAINVVIIVAGIIVFVMLVWGGIAYMISGGDKTKTEEARNRITYALIGLAIVAAAWALTVVINTFFGTGAGVGNTFNIPPAYQE